MYVEQYKSIYGWHSVGSNVHNLVHIIEDLENCHVDNLIKISTYKFENALRLLGLKLKHCNRPLEQVVCRITEQNRLNSNFQKNTNNLKQFEPKVCHEFKLENQNVFKTIEIAPAVTLSSRKNNDSWFLTNSKEIVKFEFVSGSDFKLHGKTLKEKEMFFNHPISSTKLDIFESDAQLDNNLKSFDISCVQAKMICLSHKNNFVFIPLAHSLENLNK